MTTRLGLEFMVSTILRFISKSQHRHLKEIKHILRYIKTTIDFGLFYQHINS